jgi:hypothetical protein
VGASVVGIGVEDAAAVEGAIVDAATVVMPQGLTSAYAPLKCQGFNGFPSFPPSYVI